MIVSYNNKYDDEIKDLLVELQEYIVSIDKEKYNILTKNYGEKYFVKTMEEIKKYNGKMLLYKEESKIVGLVVGVINNEKSCDYDFKAPKRGRITELIISKKCRRKGYGKILLNAMEKILVDDGCEDILLEVFGYNKDAIDFYEKNGYHTRILDMLKSF